ncbi:MAG: glycerol acyltransferase [Deltaproteobacteria bacterium]|nr:MAG: glycerol acyltransferase [Deltaproteobacteria bacterium]
MATRPGLLPVPGAPVEREPRPPARRRVGPIGLRRLLAFRARVRAQLARACLLERRPPERFGFRFDTAARLFGVTGCFYRKYFRVQCYGIESLPAGPFLLVANHSSRVLSWDGAMVVTACLLDAEPPRLVHGMADHRLMTLPVLGAAARLIGAVDGRRPACEDLKPFRERYRLRGFGHGFVHVALATGAPIVPVAVIGAEEEAPLIANPAWLARLVRTPVAPITPTIVVPLPVKYRLHFGAPIRLKGSGGAEVVARHAQHVRAVLQDLIARGLAARHHVFF